MQKKGQGFHRVKAFEKLQDEELTMVLIMRLLLIRRLLEPDATSRVTWVEGTFADAAIAERYLHRSIEISSPCGTPQETLKR